MHLPVTGVAGICMFMQLTWILDDSMSVHGSCWNAVSKEPEQRVSVAKLHWHSPVYPAQYQLGIFLPGANEGALRFSLDSAGD